MHEITQPAAPAPMAPTPSSPPVWRRKRMKDRPGVIPVETMRRHFEGSILGTSSFAGVDLEPVIEDGAFSHFKAPDTDALWMGFAIGMRCAERVANPKIAGGNPSGAS